MLVNRACTEDTTHCQETLEVLLSSFSLSNLLLLNRAQGLKLGYDVGVRVYNELCKNYIIDCSNGLRYAATIASSLGSALALVVVLVSCVIGLL
jgi:hypothetical protein